MKNPLLLLLPLLFVVSIPAVSIHAAKPNILLIVSEDNGPELGCYGAPYARTPNLDKLASERVRFERAFVAQAGCSQSRASILTGLYPHQHGQIGLATWGFRLYRDDTPNIVSSLKAGGYRTGMIGKLHINPESAFPFDFHEIKTSNFDRKNIADYASYAEAFITADNQPFFLSVNYPDAHDPWLRQVDGLPKMPLTGPEVEAMPYFGIDPPEMRDLIADEITEWREHLFTEYHTHGGGNYYPQRTVRGERFKLIENLLPGTVNPGAEFTFDKLHKDQIHHGPGNSLDLRAAVAAVAAAPAEIREAYALMQRPPRYELYDLEIDPHEFHNLADSPDHGIILAELSQFLTTWRQETRDPLLDPKNLERLTTEVTAVTSKAKGKQILWRYPDYFFGKEPSTSPTSGKNKNKKP